MADYKLPALSYSSISKFETCPYQWKETYINKSIKFTANAATDYGNEVHKAFDQRFKTKKPLTGVMSEYEPLAQTFEKVKGSLESEKEIAIDKDGNLVSWWDKSVTERAKLDVFVNHGDGKAIIWAWKTGSYRPSEELEYFSTLVFQTQPTIEKIKTGFQWLKKDSPPPTIKIYTRDDYEKLRKSFDSKIERIEESLEHDRFPKVQSGLCKNYCGSPSCQHSGAYNPNHMKKE